MKVGEAGYHEVGASAEANRGSPAEAAGFRPAAAGLNCAVWEGRTRREKEKKKDKRNREQGTRKREQGRSKISHPGLKLELNLPGFEMTMFK